jgi:hypothetical protein
VASVLIALVVLTGCTTSDPAPSGSANATFTAAVLLEDFAGRAVDKGAHRPDPQRPRAGVPWRGYSAAILQSRRLHP